VVTATDARATSALSVIGVMALITDVIFESVTASLAAAGIAIVLLVL
jgi:hypothetical protein